VHRAVQAALGDARQPRPARRTDEIAAAERMARLGQWRQMPLTVGLALALIGGAWHVWGLRDRLDTQIRYEIGVHDRDSSAHAERLNDVRTAWSRCLELSQQIAELRVQVATLRDRDRQTRRK
jgi:hypothetical protein